PQVDARQVESEHLDGPAQAAQAAARDQLRSVGAQRARHHVEIATKLGRIRIGLCRPYSGPWQYSLTERMRRLDQARVDAGDGATVRLGGATRRSIGRAVRGGLKLAGYADIGAIERQLCAKLGHPPELDMQPPRVLHFS